ncbi:MAG TPA: hypothetical protein VM097_13780 [Mycobacteriales bacterium]|nr:hypothetical protein [Mycobacteriales bacterium]
MKRLAPVLVTLLLTAACSGSKDGGTAVVPSLQPAPTASPCPKLDKPAFTWPKEVPKDLPQPPDATFDKTTRTPEGLTIVRFSTAHSLQESVLFVVREIQKAGFTLGRGDAEPAEADAPFGRGNLRGVYKMLAHSDCLTDWLVAVTMTQPTGTSPLLPTASRGPSSQPLPFG